MDRRLLFKKADLFLLELNKMLSFFYYVSLFSTNMRTYKKKRVARFPRTYIPGMKIPRANIPRIMILNLPSSLNMNIP